MRASRRLGCEIAAHSKSAKFRIADPLAFPTFPHQAAKPPDFRGKMRSIAHRWDLPSRYRLTSRSKEHFYGMGYMAVDALCRRNDQSIV